MPGPLPWRGAAIGEAIPNQWAYHSSAWWTCKQEKHRGDLVQPSGERVSTEAETTELDTLGIIEKA